MKLKVKTIGECWTLYQELKLISYRVILDRKWALGEIQKQIVVHKETADKMTF